MSANLVNEFLINIYTNDRYRELFFSNKKMFLKFFPKLKKNEKLMLLKLDQEQVIEISQGLKYKLWNNLKKFYRPLTDNNEKMFFLFFEKFYLINKKSSYDTHLEYAKRFGFFLLEIIQQDALPVVLFEIIKYCLQKIRAKILDLPDVIINSHEMCNDKKPYLYPNVILELYSYEMKNLSETNRIEDLTKTDNFGYLMYSEQSNLQIYVVSEAIYRFLVLCNGIYSLQEIIDAGTKEHNYSKEENNMLIKFVQNLKENNLLYFL